MSKTYYKHVRPTLDDWVTRGDRKVYDLTLAARIDENEIVFGIAVVSRRDQYNKKEGREHAEDRLKYVPTFRFPIMHEKPVNSLKHWTKVLEIMAEETPDCIRNLVFKQQAEFDKTQLGIQRKMDKQRQKAEQAEFLKQRRFEDVCARLEEAGKEDLIEDIREKFWPERN